MPAISTHTFTGSSARALRKMPERATRTRLAAPLPPDALPAILHGLSTLLHRRWSVPVLAELHRGDSISGGAKFITLVNRLHVSRDSLSQTLDHLIALDYILRNPGVGHPMRPEYNLAEDGYTIAPSCEMLLKILKRRQATDLGLRKWSLPVILAVGHGATRFSALRTVLPDITARALTLSLKDLAAARLINRRITDGFPPGTLYALTPASRRMLSLLRAIATGVP